MIKITNLHKRFNSNQVLNGVELDINDGETMVIIGRSGSGKSVFLKHLIGLLKPDEGSVEINGVELNSATPEQINEIQKKFNFLFQGSALFDSLTVGENVAFGVRVLRNISDSEIDKIVREKLQMVGLEGIENVKPADLSGGMKKRVGLARAIATDPECILYDEPTTGLDPIMADVINDLIINLQAKLKLTSVVVTHDMVSAYKIANRIAMLYQGKIIMVGTPDEFKNTTDPIVRQFITGSGKGPITLHTKE